jgi:hypothetical protein
MSRPSYPGLLLTSIVWSFPQQATDVCSSIGSHLAPAPRAYVQDADAA